MRIQGISVHMLPHVHDKIDKIYAKTNALEAPNL